MVQGMVRRTKIGLAAAVIGGLFGGVSGVRAQPASCVEPTASWSVPYSLGNIQAITFFVWQQVVPPISPLPLFAVLYRTGELHLHINVPQSIAQPFTSLTSADSRYASSVQRRYHQALLAETGCPLLSELGNYLLGESP